jgi:DNA-binding Lrp family transcriptional regulator
MGKIDYGLVYLRSENARMSLKELSDHLKKTPQRLKYSLSSLEKDGIIRDPHCIFDYSHFGLILFKVYFKGVYIKENEKERIIRELNSNPYVVAIYELTGEFDLVVEFAAPNPSKFNKELKKITQIIPKLNDYKIVLNLVTHISSKHYLIKNESLHALNGIRIIGGDRERELFSKEEMSVMKSMFENPVIRYTRLASSAGLNVKTAKRIFRGLVRRNIIKGFRYIVDTDKLGINKSRVFLRLHNLNLEKENQLMKFVIETKGIVQINKTVGDWDMEIDMEALNKSRIRYIVMQLREEFKDIIERFSIIEFYDYYKRNYLPSYLFGTEQA